MSIKKKIVDTTIWLLENKNRKRSVKCESQNMKNMTFEDLTEDEKKKVKTMWNMTDCKYHRMFKTFAGFDARFVSDVVFLPRILRALNPIEMARAFEEKNLYSIIYPQIPQPKNIVMCNRGCYFFNDKIIDFSEAVIILNNCDGFIIKPTHDSTQGNNVRYIRPAIDDVKVVLEQYGKDFITQEKLSQSSLTSVFNNTSLNSFRISTLNINGRASLCNILFRCGQNGSVVDNGGAGGLMCGVFPDGKFHGFAYDKYYNRHVSTKDGIRFEGHAIPFMEEIVDLTLKWHTKYLPHIGFAGWDIALDENDNPVMIEVNLRWPGIQFEQLCSETPLFGDRTEEVIDFVNHQKLRMMDVINV